MKKILSVILALCMITMLCLSASAGAYYEYDNRMSTLGMRMTSALYVYSNSSGGVDISGLTRIETGTTPAYTSFTICSDVICLDTPNINADPESLPHDYREKIVNSASSNSAYYVQEHYVDYTGSIGLLLFLYHDGWVEVGEENIFDNKLRVTRSMSSIDLSEAPPEINELMR